MGRERATPMALMGICDQARRAPQEWRAPSHVAHDPSSRKTRHLPDDDAREENDYAFSIWRCLVIFFQTCSPDVVLE